MLQVTEFVSNETFQGYTKFALQYVDLNISFKITMKSVEVGGFPCPYLLCRLPNDDCIMIKQVTEITPVNFQQREVEYLVKRKHGENCILFCS